MPTTITSSAGTVFHLWQLPALSSKGVEPGIEFSELRNDLGNGYRSQVLYGSNTGQRSWSLKLDSLADTSVLPNTVTGVNGETVSREAYLWDLYCETRVTGKPFVYTCPRNGQYYLVDFKDKQLKYAKQAYVKLYSTGLEIEQVRMDGETVFNPLILQDELLFFNETSHGVAKWSNVGTLSGQLGATGDVVFSANPQNGLNTVRFNGSADTGYLAVQTTGGGSASAAFADVFIVMKMREGTFSNNAGILSSAADSLSFLRGTLAGSTFQNLSMTGWYAYRKDGVSYLQSAQAAPMNTWGVVQLTASTSPEFNRIGKDQNTAGTFAKVDIGEIIVFQDRISVQAQRELVEHFAVKWEIS